MFLIPPLESGDSAALAWTRAVGGCLLAAAVLLCAAPLAAQSREHAGREIAEVGVEGNVTLTEQDLLFYLGLEVGSRYDPTELNRRLKELWERDLIDDISIAVEPVGDDRVRIEVEIEERPLLVSIDYQGLDKLKRSDITEMIDRKRLELFEGSHLSKGELARLEAEIEALYAEKGYRFADAAVQLERVSQYELRVLVIIDEGDKVKIGKVTFDGNEVFGDGTLRSAMKKTKKSNLLTRIRKRDIYNPATIEQDLDHVRELYRNAGYKNLVIGEPETYIIESGEDSEGLPKRRQLGIVVPLEEGERWKLGEILFEGNQVLPSEFLKNAFEQPKGGWLRADVIEKGIEQIQEFYSNTGYMFARIEDEVVEREDLIADVRLQIDEGDQFRVGRIEFEGNSKTKDRVLRRSLRVHEGMVFNSAQLKSSLFRINQLQYFKVHQEEPVELDIDNQEKKVNLTVKGDEAERTELTFGGGYSEIDGFFLQGGIRTRNFLGRGETLAVQLQTGRYTEQFDVSYFVPWLRDKPQNVGIQIFSRDLDFDLLASQRFVRKEQGGSVTYQRVIGPWSNVSFGYTNAAFEDFRSFNFFGEEDQVVEQAFDFTRSAFSLGWSYDKRDSALEATRGIYARTNLEYAGGFLGGGDWYVRPILGLTYFKPITIGGLRTVAAVNVEGGLIDPFGSDDEGNPRDIFFLNRFFLGGEQSVRGFQFRSVWARDFETGGTLLDNGFPKGGDKFFQLNLEYQFLLGGPFRLVPFIDAANVYAEEQSYDLGHLRYSGGLELRINVPLFGAPLRFIWSQNLDPLKNLPAFDQERFQSFDFSIGTSF
ncbi:MAG TPA: outer membrane protein assembly factor BamA [Thermoanaerobaculia bacterium]|nr:outer membrane protein assembly factor BamA [Thermoanaerobaculia bacterium]